VSDFTGKRSKDFPAWAIITCPRDTCGLQFMVRINEFLKPRTISMSDKDVIIRGRCCPYCQMTAMPPKRKDLR